MAGDLNFPTIIRWGNDDVTDNSIQNEAEFVHCFNYMDITRQIKETSYFTASNILLRGWQVSEDKSIASISKLIYM